LDEPERLPCAKARLSERPQVFDPAGRRKLRRWKTMKGYRTVLGMAHGTPCDDRRLPERDRRAEGPAALASCPANGSTSAAHSPLRLLAREAEQ